MKRLLSVLVVCVLLVAFGVAFGGEQKPAPAAAPLPEVVMQESSDGSIKLFLLVEHDPVDRLIPMNRQPGYMGMWMGMPTLSSWRADARADDTFNWWRGLDNKEKRKVKEAAEHWFGSGQ